MFWAYDFTELLKPIFIIDNKMNNDEKLNTIMRIILLCGVVLALILNNFKFILLILIIFILSILIYNFDLSKENFNNFNLIDNKLCIKPTKDNPLMNLNIFDNRNKLNYKPCDLDNKNVKNKVSTILNNSINYDDNNIYGKNYLDYIFYNVPNSNLPNDQESFANWLYKDYITCKDDGGHECYKNLFTDLRIK